MTIEIPKNVEVIEVVGLKEWLEEHDKQIRADAIEEYKSKLIEYMGIEEATKYGNRDGNQMDISYGTMMNYEIKMDIEDVASQLKEQK